MRRKPPRIINEGDRSPSGVRLEQTVSQTPSKPPPLRASTQVAVTKHPLPTRRNASPSLPVLETEGTTEALETIGRAHPVDDLRGSMSGSLSSAQETSSLHRKVPMGSHIVS